MNEIDKDIAARIEEALRRGEDGEGVHIFHTRSNGRGALMRVSPDDGRSLIAKVWPCCSQRDRFRRAVGMSNGKREWRVHSYLRGQGLSVPTPVTYRTLTVDRPADYELLLVEDLGATKRGLVHLKEIMAAGAENELEAFEDGVIDLTHKLIRSRVIDIDHQINNIVLDEDGRMWRIDFECARRFSWRPLPAAEYGTMLGRLICSHVYGTQPDVHRSQIFAQRLADRLKPPAAVLSQAKVVTRQILEKQRLNVGVESQLALAW